ncbi:MAG: hypothetical protein FJW66_07130, partial [Actinobacteria bacterium]|nr:hypothetical protein [Actinomycetota bacterium]
MTANIKNMTIFLLSALAVLLVAALLMGQAPSSLIEVKAAQSTGIKDAQEDIAPLLAQEAELNEYENAVAALINSYRASNGIGPVAYNGALTYVAKLRSQDLLSRNYFSHYTPE